jgi:putative SOS response-associated peptidase YedK
MCGRYTLTRHEDVAGDLQASLAPEVAANAEWWKPRYNVAPTQPAPVVSLVDGARVLQLMRWGLVPFWAEGDTKRAPLMINARVETLKNKQFFRDALARKRCLVPCDGFFEWKHDPDDKKAKPQPIYFHAKSHELAAFAGLWARSRTDSGIEQLSFTIITGKPNELVAPVHDRMPIVLARDAYDAWLDPGVDADGARKLLGVPAVNDWIGEMVSMHVNKATNDDPACIAPEQIDPSGQLALF